MPTLARALSLSRALSRSRVIMLSLRSRCAHTRARVSSLRNAALASPHPRSLAPRSRLLPRAVCACFLCAVVTCRHVRHCLLLTNAVRSHRPLAPPSRAALSRRPLSPPSHAVRSARSRRPLALPARAVLSRRPLAPPSRAALSLPTSLPLLTGKHRTPPHAERVERCLRAGPPRGDNQYAFGRKAPFPPLPFLAAVLPHTPTYWCHSHAPAYWCRWASRFCAPGLGGGVHGPWHASCLACCAAGTAPHTPPRLGWKEGIQRRRI